jgi:hypothetical protein
MDEGNNTRVMKKDLLPEKSSKKSRGEIARNPSGQRTISKEACLAETVAARESQGVCDGQNQRNGY